MIEFKLYQFPDVTLNMCRVTRQSPTLQLHSLNETKVFVEFSVFHPISTQPIIKLNRSTNLQYNKNASKNGIIDLNLIEMSHRLYSPRKIYVPFLEGRVQLEVYIFDQVNSSKAISFFFDVNSFIGDVMMKYEQDDFQITLSGTVESKTI